jgi:hypothetical protein
MEDNDLKNKALTILAQLDEVRTEAFSIKDAIKKTWI